MDKARILILEDSPPLLRKFSDIVEGWQGGTLVGAFMSLAEAIHFTQTVPIDILIADLNLPDGSGISAIKALRQSQPQASAVVVSVLSDAATVFEAIQAGATGYILKDDSSIEIIKALELTLEGKSPMSAVIARQIITNIQMTAANETGKVEHENTAALLTPREQEVLNAIARGFSYREVADILNMSAQTVPVHVRNIYRKLDAGNRSEAVFEATRQGLIDL